MKRLSMCAALLMALAISTAALAAGTVEEVTFFSNALGTDRVALVSLPEGYTTSGDVYPVVYYIPGHAGMAGNWYSQPELLAVIDSMIADGLVDPFIFVEIDPSVEPWGGGLVMPSHLTDSELNGDFERYVVEDVIGFVDSTYRTVTDRSQRFIIGRSAGGCGAARVALRHPEVFSGLGTQVGMVALEPVAYMLPLLLAEYPGGPPYILSPTAGTVSWFLFSWMAAFTPNLGNPPYFVDPIVDLNGNLDPAVWSRFASASPTVLAADLGNSGYELDIVMDVGDQDPYAPFSTVFAYALESFGIPHTLRIFEGSHHEPPLWERTPIHLSFFIPLNATVELRPRMINARNWWIPIRASVELPGDLEATSIVVETLAITEIDSVALAVPIPAAGPPEITDLDGNGRNDLNITFDKGALVDNLVAMGITDKQPFTVTIEGETDLGWFLAATDSLRAVNLDHRGH